MMQELSASKWDPSSCHAKLRPASLGLGCLCPGDRFRTHDILSRHARMHNCTHGICACPYSLVGRAGQGSSLVLLSATPPHRQCLRHMLAGADGRSSPLNPAHYPGLHGCRESLGTLPTGRTPPCPSLRCGAASVLPSGSASSGSASSGCASSGSVYDGGAQRGACDEALPRTAGISPGLRASERERLRACVRACEFE